MREEGSNSGGGEIGVLALQGGFRPHLEVLGRLGLRAREVRVPGDLVGIEGLVLPGGESSVQRKLLASSGLRAPLLELIRSGLPTLGTCAGLILLADRVLEGPESTRLEPPELGGLAITVRRNAWGRQLDSFEGTSDEGRPLLFIRAPRIEAVSDAVEVMDRLDGEPIWVRQGAIHGLSFHPELAGELWVHRAVFSPPVPVVAPVPVAI
ncbi:MAG: pyridoxal 5'-phosphate synthase glutaminase subunit PdxT [Myxococcota bacterium]